MFAAGAAAGAAAVGGAVAGGAVAGGAAAGVQMVGCGATGRELYIRPPNSSGKIATLVLDVLQHFSKALRGDLIANDL